MNCDECFRCGGTWCLDPDAKPRCLMSGPDSWCSNRFRYSDNYDAQELDVIGIGHETTFTLPENYEQAVITIVNSTVKDFKEMEAGVFHVIPDSDHKDTFYANAFKDFCPADGQVTEYVTVKIEDPKWGETKTKLWELAVSCACDCSSRAENKSAHCSGRGTYSCGACACENGWEGNKCEIESRQILDPSCGYDGQHLLNDGTPPSNDGRGDIGACEHEGVLCSNNGQCVNGRCMCNMTLEGSQYFDSLCVDICQSTNYHDSCLINPRSHGICKDLDVSIMIDPVNTTLMAERDRCNRRTWISCTVSDDNCQIKYMAKKDDQGLTHVMIMEPCNAILPFAQSAPVKVTVPVVLGVLAVVATAAAVAGYMVWKNRAPPLPLNNPGYSNIDAEDCTGMNPLYKPPTSSFKNPTYGKW
ncbi:hypothetical protein O0L34_g3909 [Tuta absoluta]|nr:hypothetical protein O0L34_g3909 [Tuta absoluta]